MIKTVEWTNEGIRMLDQRLLPVEEKYLILRSYEEVADAIKMMVVRGAPAIGVSAAMGLALGASQSVSTSMADLEYDFRFMSKVMEATRPTAVNLFWAVERMRTALVKAKAENVRVEEAKQRLIKEAQLIFDEDIEANRALGRFGGELIKDGSTVLTHCNAGALATAICALVPKVMQYGEMAGQAREVIKRYGNVYGELMDVEASGDHDSPAARRVIDEFQQTKAAKDALRRLPNKVLVHSAAGQGAPPPN